MIDSAPKTGDLPPGWDLASFGELNSFQGGTVNPATRSDEVFELYSVPSFPKGRPELLQGREIGSTKQTVSPGDVLVCKINPRINRVWTVGSLGDYEQIASSEWIGFRSDALVPGFAKHYFSEPSFRSLLCSEVSGVGGSLTRAQPRRVAKYPVPVAPLAEQNRIADQLDTLLARIQACQDRLEAIPALLKRFRQAVLGAATSGELTEDWRTDKTPDWRTVQLSEVASNFSYGSAAKSSKTGEVPVLRMGNIQEGRLDWSDLVFTSDSQEITKYELRSGDVLFNRTNSPELVGKTAVYKGERPAVYAGYLIRISCSEALLPDFLNYCLGSRHGRDYCWSVKSDGVSQSNINAKKLAAFPFRLPSLGEQAEIVRRVEALLSISDRIETRYRKARRHVLRLTPATLAKAFRGELVRQDPNDEPASALLAKVQNERAVAAAASSRKRPKMSGKRPTMKTTDKDSVQAAILTLETDRFSFDELRSLVLGDYEQLKVALFELLEERSPIVRQVFDEKAKAMMLERVRQ